LTESGFAPGDIVCFKLTEENPAEVWNSRGSTIADNGGNVAQSVSI